MKLLHEYLIQEVTYKYENETEKEMHKNHMVSKGFKAVTPSRIFNSPLTVTYQHKRLNDGIPRL